MFGGCTNPVAYLKYREDLKRTGKSGQTGRGKHGTEMRRK